MELATGPVIAMIAIVITFILILRFSIKKSDEENERQAEKEKNLKMMGRTRREQFDADMQDLRRCYGLDAFNYGGALDAYNRVFVFPEKRVVVYHKSPVEFDKIIAFDVTDNQTTITTSEAGNATTKTSTGSVLGRAVVGGMLAGGAGAVIAGSSAKRSTEVQQGAQTSSIRHDYKVYLTINDFKNPSLCIPFGDNTEAVQVFVSYLNVILRNAARSAGQGRGEA